VRRAFSRIDTHAAPVADDRVARCSRHRLLHAEGQPAREVEELMQRDLRDYRIRVDDVARPCSGRGSVRGCRGSAWQALLLNDVRTSLINASESRERTAGGSMANDLRQKPHEPIPGERDPGNLTSRQPGAVGGRFTGADIPPSNRQPWLDDATANEHALEGGKPRKKKRTTKKY
jgi:hypothetical protein